MSRRWCASHGRAVRTARAADDGHTVKQIPKRPGKLKIAEALIRLERAGLATGTQTEIK